MWGVAKRSSASWVAKLEGDNNPKRKLSNVQSRGYKAIKLLLSAGVVAKLQGDKSASQSSVELYYHGLLDPSTISDNVLFNLDGPAIRNAIWVHSRESIRANQFAGKKACFHDIPAIRANRLKPASHNFSPPKRDSHKRGWIWEP